MHELEEDSINLIPRNKISKDREENEVLSPTNKTSFVYTKNFSMEFMENTVSPTLPFLEFTENETISYLDEIYDYSRSLELNEPLITFIQNRRQLCRLGASDRLSFIKDLRDNKASIEVIAALYNLHKKIKDPLLLLNEVSQEKEFSLDDIHEFRYTGKT